MTALPVCSPQQVMAAVGAGGATGSIAITASVANRGAPCHIAAPLQLTIETAGGQSLSQIQGNPGSTFLETDLHIGEQVGASFAWMNWCGDREPVLLSVQVLGQKVTRLQDIPARCDNPPDPSWLHVIITLPPGQPEHMFTATFRLTLLGTVTSGQTFSLEVVPQNLRVGQTGFDVCDGINPCVGDGHVYERRFAFPAGTALNYKFVRLVPGAPVEVLTNGTETLNQDTVTSAAFRFAASGNGEQGGNQPLPSLLPNTGAGAMVPPESQCETDIVLTMAALMFLAGFGLRRRAL
ncbi:MAG: hypothetical protein H0X37_18645 [Herpetosiphonaceae bacterium]|nr:hypothetical protein [Herpetosiphonaceae bacterium]